jgi:hypothetical protein
MIYEMKSNKGQSDKNAYSRGFKHVKHTVAISGRFMGLSWHGPGIINIKTLRYCYPSSRERKKRENI